MRYRKRLIFAALLIALAAGYAVVNALPTKAERDARMAREDARRRGFKFERSEFVRRLTPEMAVREATVTNAFGGSNPGRPYLRFVQETGRHAEMRVTPGGDDLKTFAGILRAHAGTLDAARGVLLEGRPFRSEAPPAPVMLRDGFESHLDLVRTFSARSALALRADLADEAWTDLLAANAAALLVVPSASDASWRSLLLHSARAATWESLQYHAWTDARLAELAALWAVPDFFGGIDDVLMYRAYDVLSASARGRSPTREGRPGLSYVPDLFRRAVAEPGAAWSDFRHLIRMRADWRDYVRRDSQIDDLNVIRHYEDRLVTMRRVLKCQSWSAMRELPGMTDRASLPPTANRFSTLKTLDPSTDYGWYLMPGNRGSSSYFLECVKAEAMRRLVLAAIAVERAKLRLGRLPATLAEAGPTLPDFMDGQPLRYRPEPDGTYWIYSIGLDLVDDGGEFEGDIVWPRRATDDTSPKSNFSR